MHLCIADEEKYLAVWIAEVALSCYFSFHADDLGRSVGSFEKHCIRTLCECYLVEPLLLKKIRRNFR